MFTSQPCRVLLLRRTDFLEGFAPAENAQLTGQKRDKRTCQTRNFYVISPEKNVVTRE